jgi:hypothetical protein
MFANIKVFFAFLFILFLVSPCESDRNINNEGSTQQRQPQYLHQHENHQKEDDNFPSSSSQKSPRLIGLDVNGRLKSLLWNNPKTFMDSTRTPLFSSPFKHEDEEDEDHYNHSNGPITQIAKPAGNKKEDPNLGGLASLFLPGAVYGTADYRFRKERWYGVEKIGMLFRWNKLCPWSHCNDKDDEDSKKSRCFWSPTTLDIAAYRSLLSPSKATHNDGFTSFIDSGNIRIGWQHNDGNDVVGVGDVNPWIQVGFEPKYSTPDDDFLLMNSIERKKCPFHLRFFLPLIRRRFDLQWTSRWGNLSTDLSSERNARGSEMRNRWSSKHSQPNDDPWWIPLVSLDPSMGTLSSENRYRNAFIGRDDRQYLTEFKLRLRTTMPTLLSSVTNNAMATSDDDDNLQTASLRFECSLLTDPGERRNPSVGSTLTTARFETIVVPSFWLRSVTQTARFGLIHEQNHATNN